jgi:creatinine amidohydrolase
MNFQKNTYFKILSAMKKATLSITLILFALISFGQKLPVKMEEMTALEFKDAIVKSSATAIIPIGVLEKHGTHLPLGTDLLDVRQVVLKAAEKEYAIVFPPYIFSQIFEAKHQPGTIAYSEKIIWDVLQETCDELGRNGVKKIVLVSGHGGNSNFLPFFCNCQLANKKSYAVILFQPKAQKPTPEMQKLIIPGQSSHAGQTETSMILSHRPDLVHMDMVGKQSPKDLKRIADLDQAMTGIWWYARFPNHYAGDATGASKELGEMLINQEADQLVEMLKQVKANESILKLQDEFYNESENPLNTKQGF